MVVAEVEEAILLVVGVVAVIMGCDNRLTPRVVVRSEEEDVLDDEELFVILVAVVSAAA